MAALAEHPTVITSSSSIQTLSTAYDQDIESFLNLDQLAYPSAEPPTRPKTGLAGQQSLPNQEFSAGDAQSASFASSHIRTHLGFQGPSHQYDEHKQQTGLPPGALAQAMPLTHVGGMGFSGNSVFTMNNEILPSSLVKREDSSLDFNVAPSRSLSEMDLEADNVDSAPSYLLLQNSNDNDQFINPVELGTQDIIPAGPPAQVGRMYPGMHQQQAAMAKAAQQQRQHEFLRQQRMHQQEAGPQHQQHSISPPGTLRHPDPAVEERISRLLQQMKQSAQVPSDSSPTPTLPQMAKIRKEEHDMDEDERLLASEEGKKLSSKERRQLRNKVSARAFRSRRKEYIGQLENEIAARTTESHELRLQNRALYEENAQLTDLARMLLSSPHFSTFLDDLSASGSGLLASHSGQQSTQQQLPPPQVLPSQSQSTIAQQQHTQASVPDDGGRNSDLQELQVLQNRDMGLAIASSQTMETSTTDLNNGAWNSGIDPNYDRTTIFAVLDIPCGPAIDAEILSGKCSGAGTYFSDPHKGNISYLNYPPIIEDAKETIPTLEYPKMDSAYANPCPSLFDFPTAASLSCSLKYMRPKKDLPVFETVVDCEAQAAIFRLNQLLHSMEEPFQRISRATAHLL